MAREGAMDHPVIFKHNSDRHAVGRNKTRRGLGDRSQAEIIPIFELT